MRIARVQPNGQERLFGADEIIVSKTDTRGVITYANEVFLRVSGYQEADIIGKPHNLIRHPDMPRAIFDVLWEYLDAGLEIFAYVDNLAADGAHYWVLAHVTPTFDASGRTLGYHSNRRLPERAAVAAVAPLYAELRAVERRHSRPADALAASRQLLADVLDARGTTYDDFFWSLFASERSVVGAR